MNPVQAVNFAAAIYDPIKPDAFNQVIRLGDWIVGVAKTDGETVVAIAGSQRPEDFIADSDFLPVDTGIIGKVHSGFYRDAPAVFAALEPHLTGQISITGHSLGASRAAIIAGLCAVNNVPVAGLYMFEPAKPGYSVLGILIRCHVENIICTRNARDPVPDLPPSSPFPYQHIVFPTDLKSPASTIDPVADHLLSAVILGVARMWPDGNHGNVEK